MPTYHSEHARSEVLLDWALEKCIWVRARALQRGPDPVPGVSVDWLIGLAVGDPHGVEWGHQYYSTVRRIIHVDVPLELSRRGLNRRICHACGVDRLQYEYEWGAGEDPTDPCRPCKKKKAKQ